MDIDFLIATRNDGYCGDPMGRLRDSLAHNAGIAPRGWRFTLIDWGSRTKVSSEIPLSLYGDRVRVLYVPEDVTSRYGTPFSEVHALNYGARKSDRPVLCRLDQDTMFGFDFRDWAKRSLRDDLMYFSGRRELPEGKPYNTRPGPHAPYLDGPERLEYMTASVGALIVPAWAWRAARGYDESFVFYNHMEREFIRRLERAVQLVNLGLITEMDFYHIPHERPKGKRENRNVTVEECRARPLVVNAEDWGLGGLMP